MTSPACRTPILLAGLLLGGCNDDATPPPGALDPEDAAASDVARPSPDVADPIDASATGDAAPTPDASVDASPTPDAGVDAAPTPDVGVDASLTPDAGVDAAPTPDVGVEAGPPPPFPRPLQGQIRGLGGCNVPGGWPPAADAECRRFEVTCEGLPPARVRLVMVTPPPGTPRRGTVVFGSGGMGNTLYASSQPATTMMQRLVVDGYLVVDRAWDDGWFGPSAPGLGLGTAACRGATLLRGIHTAAHDGGAFCATANSGGSAELSYALTWWGLGDLIDLAVPTGGPPLARVDLACLGDDYAPDWRAACAAHWRDSQQVCDRDDPVCVFADRPGSAGPPIVDVALGRRCLADDLDAAALLRAESVLAEGVVLDYPRTFVHFLHAQQDCTEAVTLGALYHQAIESPKAMEYVPDTGHEIMRFVPGQQALYRTLTERCR